MEEIKSLEMLLKETEDSIKALKGEVIEYLNENRNDCLATNSKGKEILQFHREHVQGNAFSPVKGNC